MSPSPEPAWEDPLVRAELVKLARELGVPLEQLDFLRATPLRQLRLVRRRTTEALFAPHEPRFRRMARAAAFVPPAIGGPGAQRVLPPLLAARGAAAMDARVALRLCRHLEADYLVELVPHLDPHRVGAIVAGLPDDLVLRLGELLVRRKDYISLGRFVSHFPVSTTVRLVAFAEPLDLVRVALLTDDHEQLGAAVAALTDEHLTAMLREAVDAGETAEAVALVLGVLPPEQRRRASSLAGRLPPGVRRELAAAVRRVPPGASVPDATTVEGAELLRALRAG